MSGICEPETGQAEQPWGGGLSVVICSLFGTGRRVLLSAYARWCDASPLPEVPGFPVPEALESQILPLRAGNMPPDELNSP
jgi:hypothetical protein